MLAPTFNHQISWKTPGLSCGTLVVSIHCDKTRFRLLHWFVKESYLVDPASSHMLVSKTKPCMCKNKQIYSVNLRTAHYISNNLFDGNSIWIPVVILELIHA